jgi:hypothetical protein
LELLLVSLLGFSVLQSLAIAWLIFGAKPQGKLTPEGAALLMRLKRGGVLVRVLDDENLMYRSPRDWNG